MFKADLHTHTTCSDGTLTPEALVIHAKAIGLSAIAITDHDNIQAYKMAIPAAMACGLILGTGVEFSSVFKSMSVHILGYDIDLNDPGLLAFCKQHRQRRLLRNRAILDKLEEKGMPIDEADLLAKGPLIGRPHIAQAMIDKGFVKSIPQAFQRYIGDGQSCYVQGENFSVEQTLSVIHGASGKAFLAHPHLIDHRNKIPGLLAFPFDGIECYYARFPRQDAERWLKLAKDRQLLVSGGSDFHGEIKAFLPLGSSWVNESIFHTIFQKPLGSVHRG